MCVGVPQAVCVTHSTQVAVAAGMVAADVCMLTDGPRCARDLYALALMWIGASSFNKMARPSSTTSIATRIVTNLRELATTHWHVVP